MSLACDYVTSSVSIIKYEMKCSVPHYDWGAIRDQSDRRKELESRKRHDITPLLVSRFLLHVVLFLPEDFCR